MYLCINIYVTVQQYVLYYSMTTFKEFVQKFTSYVNDFNVLADYQHFDKNRLHLYLIKSLN